MHDLLTSPALWIVVSTVALIVVAIVPLVLFCIIAAYLAPEGYEDETGFHRGPTHDHPSRDSLP